MPGGVYYEISLSFDAVFCTDSSVLGIDAEEEEPSWRELN
jgi:hypothetical protein